MRALNEPLFQLSDTDIATTDVEGPTLFVGRPRAVRAHVLITTASASQLGQVIFKWQGTFDPTQPDRWEDVASTRDDNGVLELEHTYAVLPSGRFACSFTLDVRGLLAVRLLARAAGNGQVGDAIVVEGVTW